MNCATDMVSNWAGIGYTPDLVAGAWREIQNWTHGVFPDKYLDLVVIPDPKAFRQLIATVSRYRM